MRGTSKKLVKSCAGVLIVFLRDDAKAKTKKPESQKNKAPAFLAVFSFPLFLVSLFLFANVRSNVRSHVGCHVGCHVSFLIFNGNKHKKESLEKKKKNLDGVCLGGRACLCQDSR